MTDFFDTHLGATRPRRVETAANRLLDAIFSTRVRLGGNLRRLTSASHIDKSERVLIVGVQAPSRPGDLARVAAKLAESYDAVDLSIVDMGDRGKFENISRAISVSSGDIDEYEWIVIVDDDIDFDRNFLETYLFIAKKLDLKISQPAHRFYSYSSYAMTRRQWGSIARLSQFVEIGPLTVLHRDTFKVLLPFPESRWCYGIDVLWSDVARREGWRMGIVDATPISHLRPVAGGYNVGEAIAEGRAMIRSFGLTSRRADLLKSEVVIRA